MRFATRLTLWLVVLNASAVALAVLWLRAEGDRWSLEAAALGIVGLLGLLLHWQLVRRDRLVATAIESLRAGRPVPEEIRRGGFSWAVEAARGLAGELSTERAHRAAAGRRLARLNHLLDLGVLLINPERELDFTSYRVIQLLGLENEGEMAKRWAEMRPVLDPLLDRAEAAQGQSVVVEITFEGPRGPRPFRGQIQAIEEEDCIGFLILLRDRESLQGIERDLRDAVQLRALGRLYLTLAHDLKAPLNALGLHLELLRRSLDRASGPDGEEQARREEWIAILDEEIHRLDRGLQTLLGLTRPSDETSARFDLAGLVGEVASLVAAQAAAQGVAVRRGEPGSPLWIEGRADQVKQAVLNVVLNGLEAMPEGGELELTISAAEAGGRAVVTVADTGPGIAPALRERIFDLHVTTKPAGDGIGLYVARSVLESHGGELRLVSGRPRGTAFELVLPLAPAEEG